MRMYCKVVIVHHAMERNEKVLKHATIPLSFLSLCMSTSNQPLYVCVSV